MTLLNATAGASVPVWSLIPFVLMLLAIAVLPLIKKTEHWWEKNKNKLIVSLILGVPTAIYLIDQGLTHNLIHQVVFDYLPFIILLFALFVVTGGIFLSGDIKATPLNNTIMLAIGYVMASFMGTTGAAMLLIRPLISINKERKHKVHTMLFFIATVANCGGLLTPLGDPPLFMLYLRGASFTWFLHLVPEWLFTGVLLLLIYYFVDRFNYKREDERDIMLDNKNISPLRLQGNINFVLLIGIVLSVAFINPGKIPAMEDGGLVMKFLREIVLVIISALSMVLTKKEIRRQNKFTFTPIIEVAYLFLGIFTTMTPALIYLTSKAPTLGLVHTSQFYYSTGALSAFLDNTPTAVAFHSVATGLTPEQMATFGGGLVAGIPEVILKAISVAAVMFGALTYIGNGPNFMVKAIAEENGIKMPDFFRYMYRFSLIVCLPVYILIQLIFLH